MSKVRQVLSENSKTIFSILVSVLSIVVLGTSLLSFAYSFVAMLSQEPSIDWSTVEVDIGKYINLTWILFGSSLIALGLINLLRGFIRENTKLLKIDRFFNAFVLIVIGVLTSILRGNGLILTAAVAIAYLLGAINRISTIVVDHRKRTIIINGLLAAIMIVLFIITVSDPLQFYGSLFVIALLLAALSIIDVITEAFAKIQFRTLERIIRKTYAFEILLGLVFLIVAFSLVFWAIEPNMTYTNALWYCFAVVTTIGFGDVNVIHPVSRVLTVILGIYGIIVVALITSIIVNFYNETKFSDDKKHIEENKEEKTPEEKDDSQGENKE